MLLNDPVYGSFEINDSVLVELINSAPMQRLKGVSQHGLVELGRATFAGFSRYDHSIGVMLLIRKLGGSLEEQVAGLIHDSSHTAFSHVGDWVFGDPSKSDYQDSILHKYIEESGLAKIISKHGFDVAQISAMESGKKYGILERPAPDLCADRIDYTLRDAVLTLNRDVKRCVGSLTVKNGEIVFNSKSGALEFANLYAYCQANIWMANDNMLRYLLLANALKLAIKKGILTHEQMYGMDKDVVKILMASGDKQVIEGLEKAAGALDYIVSEDGDVILKGKVRYVDPKFIENGKVERLSETDKGYKKLLEDELKRMALPVRLRLPADSLGRDVIVKKSKIEGQGLFAARNFKEGEIVTRWHTAKQITDAELNLLSEESKRHVICYKGKNIVMGSPEKYVNHSCSANTHSDNFCDVANREIKKGEEITANYSETMAPGDSMQCNCGSKDCRKVIKPN